MCFSVASLRSLLVARSFCVAAADTPMNAFLVALTASAPVKALDAKAATIPGAEVPKAFTCCAASLS